MESGFHEQSQTHDMMQEVQQRAEVKQWQHNIVVYPFYNNFMRDSVCDVVTKHLIRRAPLFLLSLYSLAWN